MQRLIHDNGVITYTFEQFTILPLSVHISTRHGGVSPVPWNTLNFSVKRGDTQERVAANRIRLADALHIDAKQFVTCEQIHSRTIVKVDHTFAGTMQRGADGMVTDSAALPLSLVFADCVPIVLYDARKHVLGVCHSGWRGTVQSAAIWTLQAMAEEFNVQAGDVYAGIGPSIGPMSYEVGPEVMKAAFENLPNAERLFTNGTGSRVSDDQPNRYFDLWEANRSILKAAGVPSAQIEVSAIDTATNTHDFYSHRAEQGRCGLFSMVAWLHPTV